MKYEKVKKLYVCCGQYIAPLDSVKDKKIRCPRCGNLLSTIVEHPAVLVVKRS